MYAKTCTAQVIVYRVMMYARDKRVTEIDYQLKYAIFSTARSIVYKYCKSANIGIQGYLRILSIQNAKVQKRLNS